MLSGKLAAWLVVAVVFGQLQCASWCVVDTCARTTPEHADRSVPPCHRSHSDSSKGSSQHTTPDACSHQIASAAVVTPAFPAAAPALAILPAHVQANFEFVFTGYASAVPISSPPGAGNPAFSVLRI
jgi:hypothetical protein